VADAERKAWIVTASGDRPLKDVARDLEAHGFLLGRMFAELNIITGDAADNLIVKLRSVAGVVSVEPDAPIDIGPPGSKETW
jgi:hypothetical protein